MRGQFARKYSRMEFWRIFAELAERVGGAGALICIIVAHYIIINHGILIVARFSCRHPIERIDRRRVSRTEPLEGINICGGCTSLHQG